MRGGETPFVPLPDSHDINGLQADSHISVSKREEGKALGTVVVVVDHEHTYKGRDQQ